MPTTTPTCTLKRPACSIGGTGCVDGSTATVLFKLCTDLNIFIGGRNRCNITSLWKFPNHSETPANPPLRTPSSGPPLRGLLPQIIAVELERSLVKDGGGQGHPWWLGVPSVVWGQMRALPGQYFIFK